MKAHIRTITASQPSQRRLRARRDRRPSPGFEQLETRSLLAISLAPIGTYSTGVFNGSAAEIVAHDRETQQLFVVNTADDSIDVLDMRNPATPTLANKIDVSPYGSPNSAAFDRNVLAVALEDRVDNTLAGKVAFFKANGQFINVLTVGSLPDMLTFTPDGTHLLVANEGQPNDTYTVDPEGSVSIIPIDKHGIGNIRKLTNADVVTAGFGDFNDDLAALKAAGVRIFGPNATVAKDMEPEFIAVSDDSSKAYVTLQENNAYAVVDIGAGRVTDIIPFGYKDFSLANSQPVLETYTVNNLGLAGTTTAGQNVSFGGFSGLTFEGYAPNGNLKFIAHTDRGPNAESTAVGRPFLLPDFTPQIARLELNRLTGDLDVTQRIPLRVSTTRTLTGVSNSIVAGGNANSPHNDEFPINLLNSPLTLDPLGGDLEGIAVNPADGSYWMVDEYRPSIYHFDSSGLLIDRFVPMGSAAAAGQPAGTFGIEALPAILGQRRQNRGFEGVAFQDGKVLAFMQSPLRNPVGTSNGTLNGRRNVRVVEFDPVTRATRQFIYVMDNPAAVGADDTRADKIGDATAIGGGEFLVIERDDDKISTDPVSTIQKKVYRFSLAGATDISGLPITNDEALPAGVVPISKSLHIDLNAVGYNTIEKVEGLAFVDAATIAVINDNDFGVANIVINNSTGTFTLGSGYIPEPEVLGLITRTNGLDASDRDNRINIENWPVSGMYQPDAIASYTVGGQTYLVTANEGDSRDYPGFSEDRRLSTLTLDPTVFPNAASLKTDAKIGRLRVTNQLGDSDNDGDFDKLYAFGSRSFSIWKAGGNQTFDSGSDFERITAAAQPNFFNASNNNNTKDDRSDDKGPEPEDVVLGVVDGRTYAFIGLERIGGVMVYDVTNPADPSFVQYVNNRDFSRPVSSPAAKDLGPEGMVFIPAHDSPTHAPLLVVANEVSGTTTIFSVTDLPLVPQFVAQLAGLFEVYPWKPDQDAPPRNAAPAGPPADPVVVPVAQPVAVAANVPLVGLFGMFDSFFARLANAPEDDPLDDELDILLDKLPG